MIMRAEFSNDIKRKLASRVAYRCSFSGCKRITIGPANDGDESTTLLGEAAHIYSASPNGPRSNPNMTDEERKAITNGIWMCKSHARQIDADEINFSAETLLLWKRQAEQDTYNELTSLDHPQNASVTTLIEISEIFFWGAWASTSENSWTFEIDEFVVGTVSEVRELVTKYPTLEAWRKYVLVESQGDGRKIESLTLTTNAAGKLIIICTILPKTPRTNPHEQEADIAIGDDFDLILEDNDMGMVHGLDSAIQTMRIALNWEIGSWWGAPLIGSRLNQFCKRYESDTKLLNMMAKLEIVRLFTVSTPGYFNEISQHPDFAFINRIHKVVVGKNPNDNDSLILNIELEWGNNEYWKGSLIV
jgi:hypothetical protein